MKREVYLDGQWRFAAYEDGFGERQGVHKAVYDVSGWLDASVPGDIYTDLTRAGMVSGSSPNKWVESREWWYRTEFTLFPDFPREHSRLVFDSFGAPVTIWLNGVEVARVTDIANPVSIDVGHLVYTGPNSLAIRIEPVADCSCRLTGCARDGEKSGGCVSTVERTPAVSIGVRGEVALVSEAQ